MECSDRLFDMEARATTTVYKAQQKIVRIKGHCQDQNLGQSTLLGYGNLSGFPGWQSNETLCFMADLE
jgi:hypothetical protein